MKEDNKIKNRQTVLSATAALSGSVMGVMAEGIIEGEPVMARAADPNLPEESPVQATVDADMSWQTDASISSQSDASISSYDEPSHSGMTVGKVEVIGAEAPAIEAAEVLEAFENMTPVFEPDTDPLTQNLLEDNAVPRVPDPAAIDDLSSNDIPDYVNDANVDFFTEIV